ncbi:MAG: MarR family winged helix-turn-helix transcriptional regulator [Coprococcus sp.]
MESEYDALKLSNQLCFPLYACAKEIVRRYKPYLDEIDLTYTQYIAMMVLWEHKHINVKDMGNYLYLDSGTLTPVLKKLEQKGYLTRQRDKDDERVLNVTITQQGEALKNRRYRYRVKCRAVLLGTPGRCENFIQDIAQNIRKLRCLTKRRSSFYVNLSTIKARS